MSKPAKPRDNRPTSSGFVVGLRRFAQISAVEGIEPTAAMIKRADDFDQRRLSAAERRQEIIETHREL